MTCEKCTASCSVGRKLMVSRGWHGRIEHSNSCLEFQASLARLTCILLGPDFQNMYICIRMPWVVYNVYILLHFQSSYPCFFYRVRGTGWSVCWDAQRVLPSLAQLGKANLARLGEPVWFSWASKEKLVLHRNRDNTLRNPSQQIHYTSSLSKVTQHQAMGLNIPKITTIPLTASVSYAYPAVRPQRHHIG